MAKRIIYLAELQPYDLVGASNVSVNFSDNLIDAAELGTALPYHVRMRLSFSMEVGAFDDNVPGGTNFGIGTIEIANRDGAFDYLMSYVWDSRPITIKKGYGGDPYSAYTTCFKGATLEITSDGASITIIMRDASYKLIEPIQENKYLGTGNTEGGNDLTNRRKPLCFGRVRNLTPVWVDTALLTMQVHDGPVEGVTAVYDRGNTLSFSANYATYDALVSATINSGYYATCIAEGFIRLGAKAAGAITADVNGQFYSTAPKLPQMIASILVDRVGLEGPSRGSVTNLVSTDMATWSTLGTGTRNIVSGYFVLNDTSTSTTYTLTQAVTTEVGKTYTIGLVVKKDAIPKTTRVALIRTDMGGINQELYLDTSTGEYYTTPDTTTVGGVIDLGTEWLVYVTRPATATGFTFWVSPAIGSGSTLPPASSNTTTGSIQANTPLVFVGGVDAYLNGDVNWESIQTLSDEYPYPFEGIFLSEPDSTISEFIENLVASMHAFWYVDSAGKIVLRQFKFRTPTATIEEPTVAVMTRESSPAPLYRVITQYQRNATVQSQDDFSIPRQTLNGWLKDEKIYIPTASDGSGGTYTYTGELEVYLNDTKVNDLTNVQFREVTPVSWLALSADGTFTISNPGTNTATVTLEARIGEFAVTEDFTLVKRLSPATSTLLLTPSVRRFIYDDSGVQTPGGQTSVITASGTGLGTTTWSAVDNLGNSVILTGTGNSRTITASDIYNSPLVQHVRVTVNDTTNNTSSTTKIIIQRGTDAYAAAVLEALASTSESIEISYQNTAPTSPNVNDIWYDLDDGSKVYRWNGSSWVLTDDTIYDALTAAAGAQATADGKIKTFLGETTPTATSIGDLWYKPSTKTIYRWNGTSWSTEVGTWGADWSGSLSGIPANLSVLTGSEVINNQTLLNTIANDDIISASEKLSSLLKLDADLEGRYSIIMINATAEGLSTTALTNARTYWRNYLTNLYPKWNDTSQDTSIYTHWFADKNFPTGWTLTSATTSTSGLYTVLTDNSASVLGMISRTKAQTGSTSYAAGILVAKDSTPKTTRFMRLRLRGSSTSFYTDADTSTGQYVTNGSDGGVLDLGTEWLVYVAGTLVNGTDTIAGMEVYPAYGNNADLLTSNVALTSQSISVRNPLMSTGDWRNLGRHMLAGRLNAFQNEISNFNSQLAAWSSISGIPANLEILVGTEAINNQLILNSIAADDVLSRSEKFNLIKVMGDVENRYQQLLSRGTTLGLSTTQMTTERTNWNNITTFYNALDTTTDTAMYTTPVFLNDNFPTGDQWGSNLNSTAADGIWTAITDSSATENKVINRYKTIAASGQIVAQGVYVKKDAVGKATRWPLIRFQNATTNVYTDITLDTSTGEYNAAHVGGGISGWQVFDMGQEWYVHGAITTTATNQSVGVAIFPAVGQGALDSGYNVARTGTISVRQHRESLGGGNTLGRPMLTARLSALSSEMQKMAKAISEVDGSTTDWVDGPTTANVLYDNANTTIDANVDLSYTMKAGVGTIVTTGVSASYTVIDGVVNGKNSTNGPTTLTVTSGATIFSITSLSTDSATVLIKMMRNGLAKSLQVQLTKVLAAPSGSGGGGGGGSTANQTSGFTGINTGGSTYSQVSATLTTGVVPAGKTTATVAVNLAPKMAKAEIALNEGPWNVKYKLRRNVSGTRSDVGSPATADSNPDPYGDFVDETSNYVSVAGSMVQNFTYSVSAGTTYDLEIWATISTGTFSGTYNMNFTGTVTITLS